MNIGPSLIRTLVPLIVGYIVSFAVGLGIEVSDDNKTLLTNGIGLVVAWLYYLLARLLEQKFPALTWLLGSNVQPVAYVPAAIGLAAPPAPPPAVPPPPVPPAN